MTRIIDGKGTKKTYRLMQEAKDKNATFVCGNPKAMETKARSYGIIGLDFMSYDQFWWEFNAYKNQNTYVIDELEAFVKSAMASPDNLVGYTLSKDD